MSNKVHVRRAGDGQRLTLPDAFVTVLVAGDHAGGAYELFLIESEQSGPGPLHAEPWAKTYHVLRGRILVQTADTGYELEPGESITIEAGTMNTFSVLGASTEFLLVSAATAMSRFFRDLDAVGHRRSPAEESDRRTVVGRYGIDLAAGAGAS
ncbi:hypothetical protein [Rhodococcus sp. NPDC058514]|uniref:hypothetical protein n=1 Tax=unclassified Rhodococcus (in: high G+C Gram-positive bacteria) TaxID=192944 RepID=UPI00364AF17B